jgi:hypothetical protein
MEVGMYLFIVLGTMLVFPLVSWGVAALAVGSGAGLVPELGRWFVFWAFGIRLFIAGLRQVFQPSFTAKEIFEIDDAKAHVVVQELGFANIAFGVLGLLAFVLPGWIQPASLLGAIFYGLAGLNHIRKKKNSVEVIAMVSDLYAAVIFLSFFVFTVVKG